MTTQRLRGVDPDWPRTSGPPVRPDGGSPIGAGPEQGRTRRSLHAVGRGLRNLGAQAWPGVAIGVVLAAVALAAVVGSAMKIGLGSLPDALIAAITMAGLIGLAGLIPVGVLTVAGALFRPFRAIPRPLVGAVVGVPLALVAALTLLSTVFALSLILFGLPLLLLAAVTGGIVSVAAHRGLRRPVSLALVALAAAPYVAVSLWLADAGAGASLPAEAAPARGGAGITAPDPSAPGPFVVRHLTYGSGTDRRPEYGAAAAFTTPTVDATRLLPARTGWKTAFRERYWGFDTRQFPLNGHVWYPDDPGPSPLVLIVHGNANMADPSEAGYAYLGELLASRGFIVASVDQNFLNASWADDLQGENPARAWLLLEHLRIWRDWNATAGQPFAGKVDLDNIALIGHSRGGEAVAIAAAFNRLAHYPEDPEVPFDYGFAIQALVAIAPTDGMYQPAGQPLALANVDYLGLQGDYDGAGTPPISNRQYRRVEYPSGPEGPYGFKSVVAAHRANHGQFNTVWGRSDLPHPLGWLLNTRALLSGEEQRQIARVYITAFLEASLQGQSAYLPLFRDPSLAGDWLPRDRYVTAFADSRTRVVSDFAEDLDPATTTVPGGTARGEHLSVWQEQAVIPGTESAPGPRAVHLGWQGGDGEAGDATPTYTLLLPGGLARAWQLSPDAHLVLSLAHGANEMPAQDFTVELAAADGATASLPLSAVGLLHPAPPVQAMKVPILSALLTSTQDEPVLQTYEIPLADFVRANPGFDASELRLVRLRFDRTSSGAVLVGGVSFRAGPLSPPKPATPRRHALST